MTITREQRSIRIHLVAGIRVAIQRVGGFGGWGVTAELTGAFIARARSSSIPISRRCSTQLSASSKLFRPVPVTPTLAPIPVRPVDRDSIAS
jgi:hypothetical protein